MTANEPPGPELAAATLASMANNVAIIDPDGEIVYTNRSWDEFSDREGGEESGYVGENYLEVALGTDDEGARRAVEGLMELLAGAREEFSMEYPCHGPSERRWFVLQAWPIIHQGRRHAVVMHVDITDRRLTELQVERRNEELRKRQETLALVNQIVRHDIRNDMEVIIGWTEQLSEYVDGDGQGYLEEILTFGHHVVDLTRSVGDLVDTIVEDDEPDVRAVDLAAVVEDELGAARNRYARRPGTVTIRGPTDPPDDATVVANDLLSSVVGNLVDNAVLHNDRASPTVEVAIDREPAGGRVVLSVADDGPGIADERKDEVFGRGEMGLESSGSGLGLYLVDRLTTLYGGEAHVEDAEPRGSVFRVSLPAADHQG